MSKRIIAWIIITLGLMTNPVLAQNNPILGHDVFGSGPEKVIVLHGFQEDYYNKTIAKWLPIVKFAYIDNAGHYPMQETPILFATLMEAHFSANK